VKHIKWDEASLREMISIPANVAHSAEAVETLVAYDIFTPPREDWLTGADACLRSTAE